MAEDWYDDAEDTQHTGHQRPKRERASRSQTRGRLEATDFGGLGVQSSRETEDHQTVDRTGARQSTGSAASAQDRLPAELADIFVKQPRSLNKKQALQTGNFRLKKITREGAATSSKAGQEPLDGELDLPTTNRGAQDLERPFGQRQQAPAASQGTQEPQSHQHLADQHLPDQGGSTTKGRRLNRLRGPRTRPARPSPQAPNAGPSQPIHEPSVPPLLANALPLGSGNQGSKPGRELPFGLDGAVRAFQKLIARRTGLAALTLVGFGLGGLATALVMQADYRQALGQEKEAAALMAERMQNQFSLSIEESKDLLARAASLDPRLPAQDIAQAYRGLIAQNPLLGDLLISDFIDPRDGGEAQPTTGTQPDRGDYANPSLTFINVGTPDRPVLRLTVAQSVPLLAHSERFYYAVLPENLFNEGLINLMRAGIVPEGASSWLTLESGQIFLAANPKIASDIQFFVDAKPTRAFEETAQAQNGDTATGLAPNLLIHEMQTGERLVVAEASFRQYPLSVTYAAPLAPSIAPAQQRQIMLATILGLLLLFSGALLGYQNWGTERLSRRVQDRLRLANLFERAEEKAHAGSWSWVGPSQQLYVSGGVMGWLGHPARAHLLDMTQAAAFIHPKDLQSCRKALHLLAEGKTRLSIDLRLRTTAGKVVWARIRGTVSHLSTSEDVLRRAQELDTAAIQDILRGMSIAGGLFDITLEKEKERDLSARLNQAQEALAQLKAGHAAPPAQPALPLQEALETVADAFAFFSPEGTLLNANTRFKAMKGLTYPFIQSALDRAQELEQADGTTFRVTAERLADGTLVAIAQDITDLKQAAGALQDRRQSLSQVTGALAHAQQRVATLSADLKRAREQADAATETLLGNVSHELKTPLNAIIGYSEILENPSHQKLAKERYQEYGSDIVASGRQLLGLVDNMLNLSEMRAGRIKLDPDDANPDDLIDAGLERVREEASRKQIEIVRKTDTLPLLFVDIGTARQVFEELLHNAVRFTPDGGRITIAGTQAGGMAAFSIIDTGIGIRPETLKRAGEPFLQSEALYNKSTPGLGIGLSLAKAIVDLHGGTLDVRSKPDEGTTVTFTLPLDEEALPLENLSERFLESLAEIPSAGPAGFGPEDGLEDDPDETSQTDPEALEREPAGGSRGFASPRPSAAQLSELNFHRADGPEPDRWELPRA